MKKLFTFVAAAAFALTAGAQQVWDFTVIPTQICDGTGNLRSSVGDHINDDGGASWSAFYNAGGIKDEEQFTVKAGELFEQTKGLSFGILDNDKMVLYRNYPAEYGGCHLYFNKQVDLTIPCKAGQYITFTFCSGKNNKNCTSMDIEEGFITAPESKNGNSEGYVKATCRVAASATEGYIVMTMNSAVYVQKIEVTDSDPTAVETLLTTLDATTNTGVNDGSTWNFNDGYTITNELGNRNYSSDGKYMTIGKVTATAARYHKINVPAGVTVSSIEIEGYTNNDGATSYSYVYKINDVEYDEFHEANDDPIIANRTAKYGFPNSGEKNEDGSQKVACHKIPIENPTAGGSLNIGFTGTNAVRVLFRLYGSGGTTGIETVETIIVNPDSDAIYNLSGQKVGKDYKGIVIVNGRKCVQK